MRILVPVDGREMSLDIVDFLKARHRLTGESPEIEFFFAEPALSSAFSTRLQEKDVTEFYDERSKDVFERIRERLGEVSFKTDFRFRPGKPAECILQEAHRFDAEMIVMGTRGHGSRTGFLFGSVSNAVVARTTCPVLIIQGKVSVREAPTIALAVDGSAWSERAVDYLIEHRALFGDDAEIRLIHVVPSFPSGMTPASNCVALSSIGAPTEEAYIRSIYQRVTAPYQKKLEDNGIKAVQVPLSGPAGQTLAQYVEEESPDLVVLGSHGYGNFKAALLGSVAMTVASAVGKPLLIIR